MIDINKIFYSNKSKSLHKKCVFCEENILEYEHGYVIEKAFKYNGSIKSFELIFEYALCSECIQRLSSEMSKKSKLKVEQYFIENIKLSKLKFSNANEKIEHCMITGDNVQNSKEYQIAGFFIKNKMVVSENFPYAISSVVIEEIQELISEKTRKFSDTFKDLILPPDVREKFPKDRIVIF